MRTTKSKKPITIASVCVAAVACAVGAYRFVYLPLRPADVSHARISINATGKFDESQIDGAVKADLARLKSWNGCRVDAVRYDAKRFGRAACSRTRRHGFRWQFFDFRGH